MTRFESIRPFGIAAVAVIVATSLFAGCSGMSISSDFDPTAVDKMKTYKAYSWLPAPQTRKRSTDQFVAKRITMATEHALQKKGMERALTGAPDFLVGWHGAIDSKLQYSTVNTYYGYGWGYWGGMGTTQTYATEYNQGSLIIDIVDAKTNELVWRGVAQAEVYPQSDPDYRNQQIDSAVSKILSQFPPK